jgi:hypothetical protein
VTYDALAESLRKHGFEETKASISNKLARATLSAKLAVTCSRWPTFVEKLAQRRLAFTISPRAQQVGSRKRGLSVQSPVGDRSRHHRDDDGLDDRHDLQRREGLLLHLHGAKPSGDPAVADETGWLIVPLLVDVIKCVDERGAAARSCIPG